MLQDNDGVYAQFENGRFETRDRSVAQKIRHRIRTNGVDYVAEEKRDEPEPVAVTASDENDDTTENTESPEGDASP